MRKSVIEKLDAIPMHLLCEKYGVPYVEGRNIRCPFPNHGATGKTPSFRFYDDSSCACFGCHLGGGPIHFVMHMENISYIEACDKLMDMFGMEKVPDFSYQKLADKNKKKDEKLEWQLKFGILSDILSKTDVNSDDSLKKFSFLYLMITSESGAELLNLSIDALTLSLSEFIQKIPENVKSYQLQSIKIIKSFVRHNFEQVRYFNPYPLYSGYFNVQSTGINWETQNNRYVFPLFLPGKLIVGFSGRTLNPNESLKYQTELFLTLDKKSVVYGLDVALPYIKELGYCIIVEGILDAVRCWSVGYKNTIAPCCSYVSDNIAILLKGIVQNFVLLQDSDYGGDQEAQMSMQVLEKHKLKYIRVSLPKGEDPDSYGLKNPNGLAGLLKNLFS